MFVDAIKIKSAQSRFIMLTEECKNNLSHYELAVFVTLLFEANYSQKQSEVKMSIKQLSILSKMGERKVYECLNALEHIHFVLKRTNYEKMKYGHENCYLIARDYLYFKQIDKEFITPAPKDTGVQSLITPAPKDSTPCREKTVPPAPKDIPIDHSYSVIIQDQLTCASSSKSTLSGFNLFWETYPSKKAKKKCLEIWKRRKLELIADEINQKLKSQIETDDQWLRGFIPNPSTYLNQDRWNDEITLPKTSMRDKELAEKKLKADERILEQERRSKELADYEANKHKQYNADGKAFREIRSKVVKEAKETPDGFKKLKDSLGMKS